MASYFLANWFSTNRSRVQVGYESLFCPEKVTDVTLNVQTICPWQYECREHIDMTAKHDPAGLSSYVLKNVYTSKYTHISYFVFRSEVQSVNIIRSKPTCSTSSSQDRK